MIGRIVVAVALIGSAAAEAPPTQGIGSRLLHALGEPFLPSPEVHTQTCKDQSKYFVQELGRFAPWALKMYDASTKIPSALLTGNIWQLGGFDQCIDINHETHTNLGVIRGQHCSVSVLLKDPGSKNVSNPDSGDWINLLGAAFEASGLRGRRDSAWASWSLCVPSSCSSGDVENTLKRRLDFATSSEEKPLVSVSVEACQVATDAPQKQPFRATELAFISVLMILVAFLALATLYDVATYKSSQPGSGPSSFWEKVIVAFSVRRSGKHLFADSPPKDSLHCLHGLRVLSTCWVVLLHSGYMKATAPTINSAAMPRLGDSWENMIVMNSTLSTDTFFLLSGLLLARGFLRKRDRFNPIMFYWHRFIRLTPVHMMLVWFYATLLYRIGSGPLWPSVVGRERDNCVNNWWTNILYINNYVQVASPCMQHTWYLAVDMQLVLASPLILIPLRRFPRLGAFLLAFLVFAAIATPFAITYEDKLSPAMLYTLDLQKVGEVYLKIYTNMYTRAGPYLIGMALAFYMHHNRSTQRLPKTIAVLGWLSATVSCLASLFGVFTFYQTGYNYNVLEASSYAALHRSAWASGVAWIIYACVSGYGGILNRFLSWNAFVPLSRLSFSVYLCHYIFLLINFGTIRTPGYFSQYDVIQGCLSTLMISTACSVILFVLIEHPLMVLDNIFTSLVSGKPSAADILPSAQSTDPVIVSDLEACRGEGYDNEGYEKSEDDSNKAVQVWVVQ